MQQPSDTRTTGQTFTDNEILAERRRLARIWKQSVDQVTDTEARYSLMRRSGNNG